TALGVALARAGHHVVAASAVSDASLRRARANFPAAVITEPGQVLRRADLALLTVPDDALPGLVAGLATTGAPLEGRMLAHASGRYGVSVLEPAARAAALRLPRQRAPLRRRGPDRPGGPGRRGHGGRARGGLGGKYLGARRGRLRGHGPADRGPRARGRDPAARRRRTPARRARRPPVSDGPQLATSRADLAAARRAMDQAALDRGAAPGPVVLAPTMGALHDGHARLLGAARTL